MCLFLAGQALGVRARTSIYLSRVAEWSRMQRGGGQCSSCSAALDKVLQVLARQVPCFRCLHSGTRR